MAETSDVIIIGGGVMGCAGAFELSKRGVKVTLLEKRAIGAGSTGRSSAIIRQHYSNEVTARMALHCLDVFEHFGDAVGGECGFTQTGFLALAAGHDREGLEANVKLQQRVGIRTEVVDRDALREIAPMLSVDDLAVAAFEPTSGYADPHLTVNAYADGAKRNGATIRVGAEVTGIRFEQGRVRGVDTPDGAVDAPIVINCSGPWAAAVHAQTGHTLPITSCRIQIATFRRTAEHGAPHPVIIDFAQGAYFRPETGDLTLAGLVDPAEAEAVVPPDDYAEYVDNEFVELVGDRLMTRIPAMQTSVCTGGYAGLYAVTPDWHPIIDELPAGSGCFVCSGFSGHGFKLAPAVGQMLADFVLAESNARFPVEPFSVARYDEAREITGAYHYSIAG